MSQSARKQITKSAALLAKYTDMEARQKVVGAHLDELAKTRSPAVKPEFLDAVRRLQWVANKLEGSHLRYGDIAKWREKFRENYSMIGKKGADRINAFLEGLPLKVDDLTEAEKEAVTMAARDIKSKMKTLSVQINEQFRRLGAKELEIFGEVMGLHPTTAPQTGTELAGVGKNLWYGAVKGRATGVSKVNYNSILENIESYLRHNTNHAGEGVRWAPGARREMLEVPVDLDGNGKVGPDQVTKDQYEKWIKVQAKRNADALFTGEHGMFNQDVESNYARKAAYMGPEVHGVVMEDFGNALEHKLRMLKGLKSLPDGALKDLKAVKEEIPKVKEELKSITGHSSYDNVSTLLDVLGSKDGLLSDIDLYVGRPKSEDMSGLDRRVAAVQSALVSPTMQLLLQSNPMSAMKQAPQVALMAAAKSNDWMPIKEITDQLRATPFAQAWDQVVGQFVRDGGISLERIHSTDSKGVLGRSADWLLPMKRSNEVAEASTVYRAVQDLKKKMFAPEFQEYAKRTWSPEDRAALVEAIRRNDDKAIQDLGATYIIKQLDMVNGSGVPTSRFNFFTGPKMGMFMTLANTPVRTAVKTIASRGKGAVGDAGSTRKNLALTARAGGLIGAQAISNAVVSSMPAAKVAAAALGGMPLYAGIMAYRNAAIDGETRQELANRNNLSTLGSTVGRMPGELASGELAGFARDLAGLGGYTAAETVAGKVADAGDIISSLRSSGDVKLGAPRVYDETFADAVAGAVPTVTGIPSMAYRAFQQAISDQPELLLSSDSPLPLIRALSWQNELDLRSKLEKPGKQVQKALEDARKGVSVAPVVKIK